MRAALAGSSDLIILDLILPDIPGKRQMALEPAVLVARRILDALRGLTLEGPKRRMTKSMGVAGIPDPSLTSQEQIISVSGLGLLAAKKNGRDRLQIARANQLAR